MTFRRSSRTSASRLVLPCGPFRVVSIHASRSYTHTHTHTHTCVSQEAGSSVNSVNSVDLHLASSSASAHAAAAGRGGQDFQSQQSASSQSSLRARRPSAAERRAQHRGGASSGSSSLDTWVTRELTPQPGACPVRCVTLNPNPASLKPSSSRPSVLSLGLSRALPLLPSPSPLFPPPSHRNPNPHPSTLTPQLSTLNPKTAGECGARSDDMGEQEAEARELE
jgi:hypothetical protein